MWDSLESARFWNSVSNWFLFGGAGITAVALVVNILTAGVKEKYVDLEIAKANEKAESERLARIKIEEKLSPRFLTQLQLDEISEKLKPFSGIRVDIIVYPQGSPDITALSSQLSTLLYEANWNFKYFTAMGTNLLCKGVVIQTKSSDGNAVKAANLLVAELNNIGIATGMLDPISDNEIPGGGVYGAIWDKGDIAPIRISIGNKP